MSIAASPLLDFPPSGEFSCAPPIEQFDRLPPQSVESEMCLLASMVLDPACIPGVRGMIAADDFFQADNGVIFRAVCDLFDAGRPVDAVILRAELVRRGVYADVGGTPYLAQLLGTVPSAAHALSYAADVREAASWRSVIGLAHDAIRAAYAPHKGVKADSAALALAGRFAAVARNGQGLRIHSAAEVCREVMDPAAAGAEEFIPTGIESLDATIGGWLRGGKHLIGGKAGMGKSALMKQAALNCAANGRTVGFISVEESRRKVIRNMLANLADVPNNRLAFRTLYPSDHAKVEAAAESLSALPLHVVDAARKLTEISAAAHRLAVEKGAEVIFVDHLHLIDGETDDNREREISKISAELKVLWRRLNVAGVEAAQLNRKGGRDRPGMENLRDSGSLEFDSDVILLLHREDYYNRSEPGYTPDKIMECNVAKNKDGAAGVLPMAFEESRLRIADLPANHERQQQPDNSEGAFI